MGCRVTLTSAVSEVMQEVEAGRAEHHPFLSLADAYGRTLWEWRELERAIEAVDPHAPDLTDVLAEAKQVAAMAVRMMIELQR